MIPMYDDSRYEKARKKYEPAHNQSSLYSRISQLKGTRKLS
jgi:hypothetical protein